MRYLLVSLILLIATPLVAQSRLLQRSIICQPGQQQPAEIMLRIEEQGISVSYATNALRTDAVELSREFYRLYELLEIVFYPGYNFLEKRGKILVVPQSRSQITISGYVEDLQSQERLIGVNVFLPQLQLGTATNKYGFYSLSVQPPEDSLLLAASLVGYASSSFQLSAEGHHRLDIKMATQDEILPEVVITDDKYEISSTQMSKLRLSPGEIKAIPGFLGEADILKSVQLLPGVQAASEGAINFIVRGGGPDQNLILLDGVPVYNASHLFGFFSVFNADAIKNVSFTKGGFPARFGGRLSSVLEVDMKEGDMEKFHGYGSLGLLASKLTLEGPILKDKSSFMISGRRTYFDLLFRLFSTTPTRNGYFFDDINAKINYKFSRKDRLYLSYYSGKDQIFSDYSGENFSDQDYLRYGNNTGALRWNHLYNDKLFSNLSATYTRYKLALATSALREDSYSGQSYHSLIEDYGLKYDVDYSYSPQHHLKAGTSYTYHLFVPGVMHFEEQGDGNSLDSTLLFSAITYAHDAFAYLEDDWKINDRWRLNSGLHYSAYLANGSFYHNLQPRLAARYLISDRWSLKGSYSYMQQYIHLLTNSGSGLPTDLWVSSSEDIAPQKSHQWAVGSISELWQNKLEFTTELYYKKLSQLIAFSEGNIFDPSANWQEQVATGGKGESYGIEFMLAKKKGNTTGWVAYSLSRAQRQFNDINEGKVYPYKYDRRHDLKAVLSHDFSSRFNIGLAFLYNTGIKATIPIASFNDIYGRQQVLYSSRNAYEYPPYHRLDLSFNWTKAVSFGEQTWTVAVYNAYNRQNPYFIYYTNSSDSRQAKRLSLFPILPSVSYSFKF